MTLRPEDVERIAELARLEIEPARKEALAAELSAVLEFAETLRRLDLAGCEPTGFAPPEGALREDSPNGRRLGAAIATGLAPEAEEGFVLVPPVVEHLEP